MKKITIYLVASEEELVQDEKEISNFIRDLNNKYEEYNIYFKLITDVSKIDEKEIQSSELFFIIFQKEIDEKSIKQFDIAYQNFIKNKQPKISTYMKKTNIEIGQSVKEFMKKLDEELGHYYNCYENIDTVKLNIILHLKTLGLGKIETKEGKIYINEKEVMTLENIPIIFNNKNLETLKKEAAELEETFWKLREKLKDDPDNDTVFDEFTEIKNKRKSVKESIFELEKKIIDLETSFIKSAADGKLSKRQMYAKKCLEDGNIEAAKEALKLEEITEEANQLLALQNERKETLKIKINELHQRADTLLLDTNNENRFKEIEETYEEAIRIEKESGLLRKTMIIYANFLLEEEEKYQKAIDLCEKYLRYLEVEEWKIKTEDTIEVYRILGIAYYEIKKNDKAEEVFREILQLSEKIKAYSDMKMGYFYLSKVYIAQEQYKQAEKNMEKAIEITEKYDKSEEDLSTQYLGLSFINAALRKYKSAEKYNKMAIEIAEDLERKDEKDEEANEFLGITYDCLAKIYEIQRKYDEAFINYGKGISIRKKLFPTNKKEYAEATEQFIDFLLDVESREEIDIEAKKFMKRKFKELKEASNLDRAMGEINASYYLAISSIKKENDYKEAVKYSEEALKILEKADMNGETRYEKSEIVLTHIEICHTLAYSYENLNNEDNAEKYYKKAIDILEKYLIVYPEKYDSDLLNIYDGIIALYDRIGRKTEAKIYNERKQKFIKK